MVSAQTNEEASRIFGEVPDGMKTPRDAGGVASRLEADITAPDMDYSKFSTSFVTLSPEWTDADRARWVIDGILPKEQIGILYADSGVGKTFILLHFACCIASGYSFFGHAVEEGIVLYFGAEGKSSFKKRIKGVIANNPEMDADKLLGKNARLVFLNPEEPDPLVRENKGNWKNLIDFAKAEYGDNVAAVFIDTLSAHNEGDENTEQSAKEYLKGCQYARKALGSTVCSAHHVAKYGGLMRGSTAFKGNSDFLLELVKSNDGFDFHTVKFKDTCSDEWWHAEFTRISLPGCIENDGDNATTLVIKSFEHIERDSGTGKRRGVKADNGYDLLSKFILSHGMKKFDIYSLKAYLTENAPSTVGNKKNWASQNVSVSQTSHGYMRKWLDEGIIRPYEGYSEDGTLLKLYEMPDDVAKDFGIDF